MKNTILWPCLALALSMWSATSAGAEYVLMPGDAILDEAPDVIIEPNSPPYNLGGWYSRNIVSFPVRVRTAGEYEVVIVYSKAKKHREADVKFGVDSGEAIVARLDPTGGNWRNYVEKRLGRIRITPKDRMLTISRYDDGDQSRAIMNLRRLTLTLVSADARDAGAGRDSGERKTKGTKHPGKPGRDEQLQEDKIHAKTADDDEPLPEDGMDDGIPEPDEPPQPDEPFQHYAVEDDAPAPDGPVRETVVHVGAPAPGAALLEYMRGVWVNPPAQKKIRITRGDVSIQDVGGGISWTSGEATPEGLKIHGGYIRIAESGRLALDGVEGEFYREGAEDMPASPYGPYLGTWCDDKGTCYTVSDGACFYAAQSGESGVSMGMRDCSIDRDGTLLIAGDRAVLNDDGALTLEGENGGVFWKRESVAEDETPTIAFRTMDAEPMTIDAEPTGRIVYVEPLTGSTVELPSVFDDAELSDGSGQFGRRRVYRAKRSDGIRAEISVEEIGAKSMGDVVEHLRGIDGVVQILARTDNCLYMTTRSRLFSGESMVHWAYLLEDGSFFHVVLAVENPKDIELRNNLQVVFAAREGAAGLELKTDFADIPANDIAGIWIDDTTGTALDVSDGVVFGLYRAGEALAFGEYDAFFGKLESIAGGDASVTFREDGTIALAGLENPFSRAAGIGHSKYRLEPLSPVPDNKELEGEWKSDDGSVALEIYSIGIVFIQVEGEEMTHRDFMPLENQYSGKYNQYVMVEDGKTTEMMIFRALGAPEASRLLVLFDDERLTFTRTKRY